MFHKYKRALLSAPLMLLLGLTSVSSLAADAQVPAMLSKAANNYDVTALKAKFINKLGLDVVEIQPSQMPGLLEVITNQGLFYVSYNGEYLIQGKLFGINDQIVNLTEESLAKTRLAGMKKFANDMIVYPAKNEKHVITVFTDITCGYCRKLHEQMDEYNEKGITVRYLAYPRAGIKNRAGDYTQSFRDLRSIWCSKNPEEALTKAKAGSNIPQRICDKPIAEEFDFGRQVGVSGTPAIILEDGIMLPGYRDPDDMAKILATL